MNLQLCKGIMESSLKNRTISICVPCITQPSLMKDHNRLIYIDKIRKWISC